MPKDVLRDSRSGRLVVSVAFLVLCLLISFATGGEIHPLTGGLLIGYLAIMGFVGRDPKTKLPKAVWLTALITLLTALFTMMALPRTILAARGEPVRATFTQLALSDRGGGASVPYLLVDERGKRIDETFHQGFRPLYGWSPKIGEKIDLVVDPKGMVGMWSRSDVDDWWWLSSLALAGMAGLAAVNHRRLHRVG